MAIAHWFCMVNVKNEDCCGPKVYFKKGHDPWQSSLNIYNQPILNANYFSCIKHLLGQKTHFQLNNFVTFGTPTQILFKFFVIFSKGLQNFNQMTRFKGLLKVVNKVTMHKLDMCISRTKKKKNSSTSSTLDLVTRHFHILECLSKDPILALIVFPSLSQ